MVVLPVQDIVPVAGAPGGPVSVISRCGKARFTVLTPSVVRMEWSPSRAFEDRASLTFVQREKGAKNWVKPTCVCVVCTWGCCC